jgi:hypothetical protein
MNAVRTEGPALSMISPEQLAELADGQAAEVPKVNGSKIHGPCPHCDEDGQV